MICKKCGAKFDGNFCPNCGEPAGKTNKPVFVIGEPPQNKRAMLRSESIKYQNKRKLHKICFTIIIISMLIVVGVHALTANSDTEQTDGMDFNELLITASQMAIIHEYNLPLTTDFAEKASGNYDIVETKTKNVYNIGGTVKIKNSNGILKSYKYISKIEYLPDTEKYKEISAKIYD